MMCEGGTLPPLLVCEPAVSGADNDKPKMMLISCRILIMASDLQSARNASIVRRQSWRLISNDRYEDVGSLDERDGVKQFP
jgi:hypothetical protein